MAEILNYDLYTRLVVETEDGKQIAVISNDNQDEEIEVIDGYVVRLRPKYD
jgi:hypothetical protein